MRHPSALARVTASRVRLERLVAYATDPAQPPRPEAALEALEAAERIGVETLLAEQRSEWARRWSAADIRIEGDPDLQRAVRFSLFHLMASVADRPQAALGARGLSGPGYRGHVFWDTDVFVLPFLAATHPPAAGALVGYRVARLAAARRAAARGGFEGARFPWESADSGDDITPVALPDASGKLVRVLTGEQEEHITADVAWAMARYQSWSGNREMLPACHDLIGETARYWASRIRVDADDRGHIDGVIGPDEYHENVDDNAFTNAMARWNLVHAASLAGGEEAARWRSLAAALVDGFDAATGRHEQFAGYFGLEPLTVADLPPAADPVAVLGWDHVQRAQLIKQADVLMLHLLVPALAGAGSLGADIDWYEPRTTHASSLSHPVHAAALARAGRLDGALSYLRQAATIDLDDREGQDPRRAPHRRDGWRVARTRPRLCGSRAAWPEPAPPSASAAGLGGARVPGHPAPRGVPYSRAPDRVVVRSQDGRRVRVGGRASWVEVGREGVELEHDAFAWGTAD